MGDPVADMIMCCSITIAVVTGSLCLFYTRYRYLWFWSLFIHWNQRDEAKAMAAEMLQLEVAAAHARYFKLMAKCGITSIDSSMACSVSRQQLNLTYEHTTKGA